MAVKGMTHPITGKPGIRGWTVWFRDGASRRSHTAHMHGPMWCPCNKDSDH